MDGVILMFVIIPTIIALYTFAFINIIKGDAGTKGITQPYKTKSGEQHTAKKSREQHLV